MNVRLFIENQEVELTDEVQFAITKEFEDLNNPTDIINDWSKTIDIPFTNNNNKLFGGIFAPNRAVAYNDGTHENVGLYFNPQKKLSFKLLWNGSLIMNGYAKMNCIKRVDGDGVYEISLNGQLGYIFQELMKLKCYSEQELEEDQELSHYDMTNEITGVIDKNAVYDCWTRERAADDVIGFACCDDGYNDNFNSENVQINESEDTTFKELLEGRYKEDEHNVTVSPDTLIGDGLKPRSFGEYRSYYQRPYIYIPKMFELLKKKINDIPKINYELMLHPKWFNSNNHYYHDLVMMLNKISDMDNATVINNTYSSNIKLYKYYGTSGGYSRVISDKVKFSVITEEESILSNDTFNIQNKGGYTFNGYLHTSLCLFGALYENYYYLNEKNGLIITLRIWGENGTSKTLTYLVCGDNVDTSVVPQTGYNGVIKVSKEGILGSDQNFYWYFDIPFQFFANTELYGNTVYFNMSASWVYDSSPSKHIATLANPEYMIVEFKNMSVSVDGYSNWNRSHSQYNFSYLWDNEHNFFETILKYCKLFRLMWLIDEEHKTIEILPADEYFKKMEIQKWNYDTSTLWDDKLDMSKDFKVTPCVMDTKYISIGYTDNETKYGEEYLTRYGVNFGDRKFYTYYDFNTETKKLIEDIPTSITDTSVGVDWDNLYNASNNGSIVHFQNFETKPYFETEDNSSVDAFGTLFFYRGLKSFDSKLRNVYLTDDSFYQQANDSYMYIDPNAQTIMVENCMVNVTTYPWLDIVDADGHLCLFNKPMQSYDVNNNYSGTTSIYTNFWVEYLNERYNLQNNKVECYLYLTPLDYVNFEFRNFVMIGNRCYMINKIEDYDVSTVATTKCELISVYNIDAYSNVNYDYPTDYVALMHHSDSVNAGETIKFNAYSSDGTLVSDSESVRTYSLSIVRDAVDTTKFVVTVSVPVSVVSNYTYDIQFSNSTGTSVDYYKLNVIGNRPV